MAVQESYRALYEPARQAWEALQKSTVPRLVVGMGGCGVSVGAAQVKAKIEAELQRGSQPAQVEKTGCNGMCHREVLVDIINPGQPRVTYGNIRPDLVPELIEDCVVKGWARPDLAVAAERPLPGIPAYDELPFFRGQKRLLMARCGLIDPEDINQYLAQGGYGTLAQVLSEKQPEEVIDQVKQVNLRGRGGAFFPSARKWETCRRAPGYPKYMICNAEEGEPSVFKDRRLLEADPHSVVEGILIAAYAIGSDRGYIYVGGEHKLAQRRVALALQQAREKGLLGAHILGSDFSFKLEMRLGAGSYAAGESSAMMSSIEGKRGMPRVKLVRSAERGFLQKPTNMNNVETYAYVPIILGQGADWFADLGTPESRGTKLFCLSGHIQRPGWVEVPFSMTARQLIFEVGGGIPSGRPIKALQPAGVSSIPLPESLLDTPLTVEDFEAVGAALGSGGMVVFDDSVCLVDLAKYYCEFNWIESCARCTTCRISNRRLYDLVNDIAEGRGQLGDLELIELLDRTNDQTALCELGKVAGIVAAGSIKHFRAEWEAHIVEKRCPAGVCRTLSGTPGAGKR